MAKKTKLTGKELDAHYDDLIKKKIAAGLPKSDAAAVVKRQRAEDEANKVEIYAEESEGETKPADNKPEN